MVKNDKEATCKHDKLNFKAKYSDYSSFSSSNLDTEEDVEWLMSFNDKMDAFNKSLSAFVENITKRQNISISFNFLR